MKFHKTPKGTELPISDIKGKPYLLVPYRIVWMREEHSEWSIETEFVVLQDNYSIAKATIKNEAGKIIATAHKREDKSHFSDAMEKAETGAIGRALALCGYGTQFTEDLFEDDRIVDSPVVPVKPATPKINAFANSKSAFSELIIAAKEMNWDVEKHLKIYMHEKYGKEFSKDLTPDEVKEFLHTVKHNSFDHAMKLLIK